MKYRILIVDDDKEALEFIEKTLNEIYELVLVSDANEALNIVSLSEPDLVLLDVMMPEKNGHQIAQWIRSNSSFSDVPILMFDDTKKPDNLRSFKESEGTRYLTKPLTAEILLQTVSQIFETEVLIPSTRLFSIERIHEIRTVKYTPPDEVTVKLGLKINNQPAPEPAKPQLTIPTATPTKSKVQIPETVVHPTKLDAVAPEKIVSFHGRILAVDDDIDLLQLLRVIFSAEHEFFTATDGFLAVRKAMLYLPDIMILDIMMTKMSGFQVIEMVRKQPALKNIPVVFLSAKSHPTDIDRAKRLGGTEYITKPFDPGHLKTTVEKLLKQYGMRPPGSRITFEEILHREGITTPQEKK
ncbi:MAG: response regulator [bacterium]|nr:response regulator [bacterium]